MTAVALSYDEAAAPAEDIVVSAEGLVRRYGEGATAVEALRGVSLDVEAGRMTAIMGPSGSGKSTLMHLMAGLDARPRAASSSTASRSSPFEKADPPSPQDDRLRLPVLQPPPDADRREHHAPARDRGLEAGAMWLEAARTVGIADRRKHRPAELSGGQQQRVALARALITRPKVIFADEPTGNLDSSSSKEVLKLLRRAVDEWGQTIVMVTHDAGAAAQADRILFLADGRIVRDLEESTAAEVLAAMQEVSSR
jgi:putative ABC transport system ATP-binding protein